MSTTTPPATAPLPTPYTPVNTNTGKQLHGNLQIAICAGGSLNFTPGFSLP